MRTLLHPFRLAAILLLVLCTGHTAGGMFGQNSFGPASDRVLADMKSIHFNLNGADVTWFGFWFGFGLLVSVFLLVSAAIAWRLASVESKLGSAAAPIAWALAVGQVANALLSWEYFFAAPAILAGLSAILLGIGAWRLPRASN